MSAPNGFTAGDEYISFAASPSPEPERRGNAVAGPSRASTPTGPRGSAKGKERAAEGNGKSEKKGKGKGKRGREELGGSLKEERKAAQRIVPWAEDVDWDECRDPAEMLNEEVAAFYRYMSPTKVEYEIRMFTIELIVRTIKKLWPDATITPFGSWQTQLYLPTGDIDLVVSTDQLTDANKTRLLSQLARAIQSAHITGSNVAIIAKARVPIIKFVTLDGELNVDISLNQTNGISAGKIINQYLQNIPGARQLILVVKAFLSQRSMNEVFTGGLGSYSVICIVISFLQIHPKLRRSELEPEKNLGTLLIELLELYGRNFNYDDVGISIRKGGFYFSKRSRGWKQHVKSFLLSIEDPQDIDNDISGGSFGIRQVRATLSGAYELLQGTLFERAAQITGRRSGRFRDEWDSDDMSILKAIMGVTKDVLRHRQNLQKLHESGRLQKKLGIPIGDDPHTYFPHYQHQVVPASPPQASAPLRAQAKRQPKKRKSKKGKDGFGAIMVDDAHEDAYESDSSDSGGEYSMLLRQAKVDLGEEDEEAYFNSAPSNRNQGLANGHGEGDRGDSRYSIKKAENANKGGKESAPIELLSDSDSSVVAVEPDEEEEERKGVKRPKVDSVTRQDFWRAKGQVIEVLDNSDSD